MAKAQSSSASLAMAIDPADWPLAMLLQNNEAII